MRIKHSCPIIQFKDDIHFSLDFDDEENGVSATFCVSSERSLEKEIKILKTVVCESFIYKYTKDLIIGDDGLLKELLWGTPFLHIVRKLEEFFDDLDDFEVNFSFKTRGDSDSTRLSPIFISKSKYIEFEIRDLNEESDFFWFPYNMIKDACIGLDERELIQAKFEQDLDRRD